MISHESHKMNSYSCDNRAFWNSKTPTRTLARTTPKYCRRVVVVYIYIYVYLRVFRPFRVSLLFSNVRVSYEILFLKSSRRTQK